MKQETNKPLYVRLNEQRTSGKWAVSKDKCDIETADDAKLGLLAVYAIERGEANAEYTALAVNNLSPLADVLKDLINSYLLDAEQLKVEAFRKAIEALKAIS